MSNCFFLCYAYTDDYVLKFAESFQWTFYNPFTNKSLEIISFGFSYIFNESNVELCEIE